MPTCLSMWFYRIPSVTVVSFLPLLLLGITQADEVPAIPRKVHQLWFGKKIENRCLCSSASWKRFAHLYGFEYKLWQRHDIDAIVLHFARQSLWNTSTHKFMELHEGLYRTSIAKYEILRQFGGLFIDCDMFWLGATGESNKTKEFLGYLGTSSTVMFSPQRKPLTWRR